MRTIIERIKKLNRKRYMLWGFGMSPSLVKTMEEELSIKIGEEE